MFKKKNIIYLSILFLIIFPLVLMAQGENPTPSINNPIAAESIQALISDILSIIAQIGAPIATIAIIYSGFLFVTARGNPEKINHAKEVFLYAIIGAAILLGAEAISRVIENTVNEVTSYETHYEISHKS